MRNRPKTEMVGGLTSGMSLRQRLLMLTLLTSGIGLLVGCGADLFFDLYNAKEKAVEDLRSTADLIGTNAAAALAFDDSLNGEKLLAALSTRPHIRLAVLYRADGRFFGSYLRTDLSGSYPFPRQLPAEVEWSDEKLTVIRPIVRNEQLLGKVLIESDLKALRDRTRLAVRVTGTIAAGTLSVVYFLTVVLGRSITGPIQRLAETARRIAERSDYSLRAPPYGDGRWNSSAPISIICWMRSPDGTLRWLKRGISWKYGSPSVLVNSKLRLQSENGRKLHRGKTKRCFEL